MVGVEKQEFDLRVDIRDPKTGQVVKRQPYSMRVEKGRPPIYTRDGIEYYGDGTLVHPEKPKGVK